MKFFVPYHPPMLNTVPEIIEYLGADAICSAVGVKPPAVRKAKNEKQFPAMWYHALERLAGGPLPRHLFSFKGVQE
jgi:hypothetical protein